MQQAEFDFEMPEGNDGQEANKNSEPKKQEPAPAPAPTPAASSGQAPVTGDVAGTDNNNNPGAQAVNQAAEEFNAVNGKGDCTWTLNRKGNWYRVDQGQMSTVFRSKYGSGYKAAVGKVILKPLFGSIEEAKAAVEKIIRKALGE
jgi:hypothetical protein